MKSLTAPSRSGTKSVARADVIVVEDEPDIGELIRFHVGREGLEAKVIQSGRVALAEIRAQPPSLVILDLMLPDLDGLEICRRLKWDEATRAVPILIVSAKGEESDIVAGLELGADDYVTKPFSPKVLMARMKNIIRRRDQVNEPDGGGSTCLRLAGGRLVIDLDRHVVTAADAPIELTRTEFEILRCLATRPGFVRTRDQIIAAVHGEHTVLMSRTVDVHVTAIRRKLGALGAMVQTVRGVGYRLEESTGDAG
ncbi:MAG: response regulator transcription factor [Phycisphaerales bacterium]|nr:response regulator transcription factor [Phycisphaerales bacterium]